ncbi:hypothetical protein INS49_005581 [Diaporthe citri]|uniref:uncharacterized protein n=1 Tax=Diaporthe citri TaxID=83186 RepID=UPI001C7EF64B|nr:uncharacterized protein INS49_005581 [Diaporthe citri]KAG6353619.1 hypothetical protein INS49_005581 [Diaporthe citri]
MEAQIGQMDRIYGNAVVTIVAATSKALHTGIHGVTAQRCVGQLAGQVCSAPVVNVLVPIQSDTNLDPWEGRAWTFQEKPLSKRLLLFHGGMVDFHCRCGVMREDMTARDAGLVPPVIGWLSLASHEILSSLKLRNYEGEPPRLLRSPVFAEYAALIEQYTPRRLSNASDAVRAILSLLKILIQSDRGGATMFHGLVEEFFDQALHWQPAAGENGWVLLLRRGQTWNAGSSFSIEEALTRANRNCLSFNSPPLWKVVASYSRPGVPNSALETRLRIETLWRRTGATSDVSSKLVSHKTQHIYETALLNKNRLEVGRVVLPDPVVHQPSDNLYDFIMLSEAQYHGDEVNVDVGDHHLLNIMMIE